jgi:hypothetical protein
MNKRLMVGAVLALAVLALCVTAAPASAQDGFPVVGVPHTAYVHLWWGSEPIIWEERDSTSPDANWYWWSATPQGAPEWWPYKPIPADYEVVLCCWIQEAPRGQVAAVPGNLLLAANVKHPDGTRLWSTTTKAAKRYWGRVMGPVGWEMPTFNKELAQQWVICWSYDIGKLPPGTYTGTATYQYIHPFIDHTWWDPTVPMDGPAHYAVDKTVYSSGCPFVVE